MKNYTTPQFTALIIETRDIIALSEEKSGKALVGYWGDLTVKSPSEELEV